MSFRLLHLLHHFPNAEQSDKNPMMIDLWWHQLNLSFSSILIRIAIYLWSFTMPKDFQHLSHAMMTLFIDGQFMLIQMELLKIKIRIRRHMDSSGNDIRHRPNGISRKDVWWRAQISENSSMGSSQNWDSIQRNEVTSSHSGIRGSRTTDIFRSHLQVKNILIWLNWK